MPDYPKQFFDRLVAQDIAGSLGVIEAALGDGMPPERVLLTVVSAAMERIGQMQADCEITLSEVFITASIGDAAIDRLLKQMPQQPVALGTVIIGTAEGDYHSLGRKIVGSFLRVAGYRVVDLGSSVSAAKFVESAVNERASVICVSALLLHTAERIKEVRQLLDERKLSPRIKLMVGGAAFNIDRELAHSVGADGTALNAMGAAACLRSLQGGKRG